MIEQGFELKCELKAHDGHTSSLLLQRGNKCKQKAFHIDRHQQLWSFSQLLSLLTEQYPDFKYSKCHISFLHYVHTSLKQADLDSNIIHSLVGFYTRKFRHRSINQTKLQQILSRQLYSKFSKQACLKVYNIGWRGINVKTNNYGLGVEQDRNTFWQ